MIQFERYTLPNGLRVIIHEDFSTPMAVLNVLYNVGARDEQADRTGFAHLFEHLMFSGSANVDQFDDHIQLAGGENNAFTNSDITNFYDVLPAQNIEVAFWLESDRMISLQVDEQELDIQRKVVLEEYKETCLNQPYGDVWHHISDMAFKVHPYQWPTIGKVPEHVEKATMQDVQDFYQKFYHPNNAVIVVSGAIKIDKAKALVDKWFADIPKGDIPMRRLPKEPAQKKLQRRINHSKVPVDALYMAFHTPARTDRDFYPVDLLSDILCNGPSARLYRKLVREQGMLHQVDAYLTGSIDPGLLIIEARPDSEYSLQQVAEAIWKELEDLKQNPISKYELDKWKNQVESTLVFSETNVLNKALNLAFFEVLGDVDLINKETDYYQTVTAKDIHRLANEIFLEENCSELYYRAD
ncbi:MAG: pitrilysin family protein [Bacteroidota bacterium]